MDLATSAAVDQAKPADLASLPADMAATLGATVLLKDDFYMPSMITINAGQKVKWQWAGATAHGVDSVDNSFPDGPIMMSGGTTTYEYVFPTAGTYNVQCLVHGAAMPMTIKVQ